MTGAAPTSTPNQTVEPRVEPWLRGTRGNTPAVIRAVLHALDLAREDFVRWAWPLSADQLEATPFHLPSVAYQARHIARSLDRLLTYAEGHVLSREQLCALDAEHHAITPDSTRHEFEAALAAAEQRILAIAAANSALQSMDAPRYVGRDHLPVTLGGLLVHLADHTQRHVGQAVTTAKLVAALHEAEGS